MVDLTGAPVASTGWIKSSYCSESACVEVAPLGHEVAVRDGKNRHLGALTFERHSWNGFLDDIQAGRFRSL